MKDWYQLYPMDCIEGARKHLKDNTVDLIITDPPYGIEADKIHIHYNRKEKNVIKGYVEIPLEKYAEWMKGLLTLMPDAKYEIKSFATDEERNNVSAYAVITGTHTGEGGPVPPTGKKTVADYVYVMEFDGGKIKHMTKIWNASWTLKELGWA